MNIQDCIADIQQPRSRYQIERFVLGQHNTPEMRFYQLCLEAQDLKFKIEHAEVAVDRAMLTIKTLSGAGSEAALLDARDAEIDLRQTELALIGARRELAVLEEIFESIPQFTREQIDAAQPDYWRERITRQATLEALGTGGAVSWAQLDALRQVGGLEEFVATYSTPLPPHIVQALCAGAS